MSGSTIGGVVGGVIGFVASGYNPAGAQWGFMIGSGIGSIVDPTVIQGAKWQNSPLQGSQSGAPRAVVLGTSVVIGNLLDADPNGPYIGKVQEGGKGGPVTERDSAILTYAIEICDSSEKRGTSVKGVLAVWEDERLVYDVRDYPRPPNMTDEDWFTQLATWLIAGKWSRNKRFYFGAENQEPPPELEAIYGVGNVPAYRGSAIMVADREDLMVDENGRPRGRMPTYKFLVSRCETKTPLLPGAMLCSRNVGGSTPELPLLDYNIFTAKTDQVLLDPWGEFPFAHTRSVAGIHRFGNTQYAFLSSGIDGQRVDEVWKRNPYSTAQWEHGVNPPVGIDMDNRGVRAAEVAGALWLTGAVGGLVRWNGFSYSLVPLPTASIVRSVAGYRNLLVCITDSLVAVGENSRMFISSDGGITFVESLSFSGDVTHISMDSLATDDSTIVFDNQFSTDKGATWNSVTGPVKGTIKYCGGNRWMASGGISFGQYPSVSTDGGKTFVSVTSLPNQVVPNYNKGPVIAADNRIVDGRVWYLRRKVNGTDTVMFSDDPTLQEWTASSVPVVSSAGYALWDMFPPNPHVTPIPDGEGNWLTDENGFISGPPMATGYACSTTLADALNVICGLGMPQLPASERDMSEVADLVVRGLVIQDANATAGSVIDSLRPIYAFDMPTSDGVLRARKRGSPVAWEVNPDDMIETDDGYENSARNNEVKYPAKLHLSYLDPELAYKQTTQTSEMVSSGSMLAGEERMESMLTMTASEAKQAAVIVHKIMRTELAGSVSFKVPLEYLRAAPSDRFQLRAKTYRLDKMSIDGPRIFVEAALPDRISAYSSIAIGVEGVPPSGNTSSLRGPTISMFLNLPALRSDDDRAGVYWFACGVFDGWRGAQLYLNRDGVNFNDTGIQVISPASIGRLVSPLGTAGRYGTDNSNTLQLEMLGVGGSLDSVSFAEILAGKNMVAVVDADGACEIVQFANAVETAPGKYTLSILTRGRLNTLARSHVTGSMFVLLNERGRFVPLRNEDSGQTLKFLAASIGTTLENNTPSVAVLGKLQSIVEWEPYEVRTVAGGGSVAATWIGRGRIGSSRIPVHSSNWQDYRLTVSSGATVYTALATEQNASVSASSVASATVASRSKISDSFNSSEGT